MSVHVFEGSARQIGNQYGAVHAARIHHNLSVLVYREGYQPLPRGEQGFDGWVRDQEVRISREWPWLLDEMAGVAEAIGAGFEDVLLLNLRAWQYEFYGESPGPRACSSLAMTLDDGTLCCAGALDDPAEYYCGPVKVVPEEGYGFTSFPLSGTSWAGRSINSKGLAVGTSSQILPGLRTLPDAINQDLALRVISQTCATVDEVREFCRAHPFTVNLVCVDARGGMFCAHHTAAGLFEMSVTGGYCALTNHVASDECRAWLAAQGVSEFPESDTTRPRLDKMLFFARERNGKCSAEEVRQFISARDDTDPGTINNSSTICLTFANPQISPGALWVVELGQHARGSGFEVIHN